VILKNDDFSRVAEFISMSRKVLKRIKLNIFFSIIYNVIELLLAFCGVLNPIAAMIFQEAGCVSVVLSSILLLGMRFSLGSTMRILTTPALCPYNHIYE
jgi:Cd2+/Zn2+-exporting ATPase